MKKAIALLMILGIFLMVGCSNNNIENDKPKEPDNEGTKTSEENIDENNKKSKKVIVDDLGYEVELPENIERIVIADLPPLVHAYCFANDGIDKLVGAPKDNALVDTMLPVIYPEVKNLSSNFRDGDTINMEELLSLNPDLILYRSDNEKSGEIIRNSGVKSIAFQTFNADNGNAVTPVISWLKTLGQILGKEEKVSQLIADSNQTIGIIQSRIWDIKEGDKTTVLYLNGTGVQDGSLKVSGEKLFGTFWSKISGAKDLSIGEIQGAKVISTEQFHKYNPDVLLSVFSAITPNEMMENSNYKGIKAIDNKRVYSAPLGMFAWYGPSTDAPLSLLWHAKVIYPEQFKDVDIVEKTKEHYSRYYNYNLTDKDITFLFGESLDYVTAK